MKKFYNFINKNFVYKGNLALPILYKEFKNRIAHIYPNREQLIKYKKEYKEYKKFIPIYQNHQNFKEILKNIAWEELKNEPFYIEDNEGLKEFTHIPYKGIDDDDCNHSCYKKHYENIYLGNDIRTSKYIYFVNKNMDSYGTMRAEAHYKGCIIFLYERVWDIMYGQIQVGINCQPELIAVKEKDIINMRLFPRPLVKKSEKEKYQDMCKKERKELVNLKLFFRNFFKKVDEKEFNEFAKWLLEIIKGKLHENHYISLT